MWIIGIEINCYNGKLGEISDLLCREILGFVNQIGTQRCQGWWSCGAAGRAMA